MQLLSSVRNRCSLIQQLLTWQRYGLIKEEQRLKFSFLITPGSEFLLFFIFYITFEICSVVLYFRTIIPKFRVLWFRKLVKKLLNTSKPSLLYFGFLLFSCALNVYIVFENRLFPVFSKLCSDRPGNYNPHSRNIFIFCFCGLFSPFFE